MKDRFLDTLKMIGICIAVIAFFTFLAASCEDKEGRAEREAAEEELHEQIWDEAYQRGYEDGFDAGYDNGYYSALEENSRSMPEFTPAPTVRPVSTPSPTSSPQPSSSPSSDDFTVYISNSGTMHKKSNCSGMTHYTEMPYSVASQYYTKKCSKCFK